MYFPSNECSYFQSSFPWKGSLCVFTLLHVKIPNPNSLLRMLDIHFFPPPPSFSAFKGASGSFPGGSPVSKRMQISFNHVEAPLFGWNPGELNRNPSRAQLFLTLPAYQNKREQNVKYHFLQEH